MTLGTKRNAIAALAQGRYLSFVDDDDDIADDYVAAILNAIDQHPHADCIVFDAWVTQDGQPDRPCRYGIEFDNTNTPEAYLRRPNHVCCVRADLARQVPREDITWGEDTRWADAARGMIQTQAHIDRQLYHYRATTPTSEPPPAASAADFAVAGSVGRALATRPLLAHTAGQVDRTDRGQAGRVARAAGQQGLLDRIQAQRPAAPGRGNTSPLLTTMMTSPRGTWMRSSKPSPYTPV